MNSRERILAALTFQPVDKVPLQIHPSPAGLFEHGQKLLDLMHACQHDFGTQQGLLLSPRTWRRFFLPRYQALFEPIKKAGKRIFFHSCGKIDLILGDLRQAGADTIWPQLPLFDLRSLARRCRELGLAIQLHPDRGELLQHASPQQVRAYIFDLVEAFDTLSGGSWLYLEVDPGFPWLNVEAMFQAAMDLRR